MNDWALYLGLAALLCALCSLLGAALAHRWGVDPSRETPGAGRKGAAIRLLLGQAAGFLAMLPAALWMSAAAGQALGAYAGAEICLAYALVCALLGFLAMFTSVRREAQGMAVVCGEELFAHANKVRSALGALAGVLGGGAMLMALLRDGYAQVTNAMLFAFSLALWPMISMQGCRLAGEIQGEGQMLSVSAGGAVCAALIAILALLPGTKVYLSLPVFLVLLAGVRLVWLAAWITLCRLGAQALHALTERPLIQRKRSLLPKTLLCLALSVPLALFADAWLFVMAAVLCALCVIMDVMACSAWLRRIGRGLFSGN